MEGMALALFHCCWGPGQVAVSACHPGCWAGPGGWQQLGTGSFLGWEAAWGRSSCLCPTLEGGRGSWSAVLLPWDGTFVTGKLSTAGSCGRAPDWGQWGVSGRKEALFEAASGPSGPSVIALVWPLPYFLVSDIPKPASSAGTTCRARTSLGERPFLCPHCRCPVETPACQGGQSSQACFSAWDAALLWVAGPGARSKVPQTLWAVLPPQATLAQAQGPQAHLPRSTFLCSVGSVVSPLELAPPTQPPAGNSPLCTPLPSLEVLPARVSCPGQRCPGQGVASPGPAESFAGGVPVWN